MSEPKIGFKMEKIRLPLDSILLARQFNDPEKHIHRYRAILCSIKEVGLVEPLIVYPHKEGKLGVYLLMDGHLRYFALRELKETEADCLVSTDDESFTYNARISRLSPIQEHRMITKAVKNGVSPERIQNGLRSNGNALAIGRSDATVLDLCVERRINELLNYSAILCIGDHAETVSSKFAYICRTCYNGPLVST